MVAFYEIFLKAKPVAQSDGMVTFLLGETKLFLHRSYAPGEDDLLPENHLASTVEYGDAICCQLTADGLEVEIPPQKYYWGLFGVPAGSRWPLDRSDPGRINSRLVFCRISSEIYEF
jgi:hypothetical protein